MAERPLQRYQEMRDFGATPEPEGQVDQGGPGNRFVIQQHDATRLHWDLRLEHDGVLLSWALPRGLPWSPDQNHLAVHTEDHPLGYLTFSGDIPEGSYGAGNMIIWDRGTYEPYKVEDKKVVITLHGERAKGRYALFQTRGRDWMVHRMDPPEDPTRRPLPDHLELMRTVPGEVPGDEDQWAFEVRWQGCRSLVASSGGVVTISDESGGDISAAFPEVRRLGRALGYTETILDGVIVAPDGEPTWIDRRLAARSETTIRSHARDHPLVLMAFDLLWLDGHPTTELAWSERRDRLEALELEGPAWKVPTAHRGDGAALAEAARRGGVTGLVAKRLDSPYTPGEAPGTWLAIDLSAG